MPSRSSTRSSRAPVPAHAHRQIEVDPGAELALDRPARSGADRFDHAAARADHDSLLRLGLDQDHRSDAHELRLAILDLLDLLDLDLDRMRDLLARARQDLLPDQLRQQLRPGLV